ncbi:MAG TPA: hypothetical protein VG165_03605 [Solirubrobacteraceae bacterium]|jgi:hypothetical protein|nr:hypothetical protein [Solirubrobacteraceae bacterium]
MRRLAKSIALLAVTVAAASCGGSPATSPGANPAAQAPGIAGLERDIQAAHGAVATSQSDAARASGTSAGP